ncbi:MAG: ankyrin repeat domain-containing protein [Archangiaceae bacterium]|nr:ankyrin repeat domain-containing protein [Archangiaceae bacterium]
MSWVWLGLGLAVVLGVVRVLRALRDVHALARAGSTERLAVLLARDPSLLHQVNGEGEQPLHQAAKYGEVETMRLLLDRGSDINARTPRGVNPEGVTPLHLAAAFGYAEAVKLLLARGAEVDPKEETGMTPIMAAQAGGHAAVIELLTAAGADATAVPAYGQLGDEHFVTATSASDPLIAKAVEKAQSTLGTLRSLFAERPRDTMVKVPFTTDTGNVEHVWARVLALDEVTVRGRIETPPTSQRGKLEREQQWRVSEIEDWQVEQRDGSIRGAFGYQVLFLRMREKGVALPRELAAQQHRFVDHEREPT